MNILHGLNGRGWEMGNYIWVPYTFRMGYVGMG